MDKATCNCDGEHCKHHVVGELCQNAPEPPISVVLDPGTGQPAPNSATGLCNTCSDNRPSLQTLSLEELKEAAKSYTTIRSADVNSVAVPLNTWTGVWRGVSGNPHMFVKVDYYLDGNFVRVHRADETDYLYILS